MPRRDAKGEPDVAKLPLKNANPLGTGAPAYSPVYSITSPIARVCAVDEVSYYDEMNKSADVIAAR